MLRQTVTELPLTPGRHWVDDNLWIQVRDEAHRSWSFRYSLFGVAHEMGLGSVNHVTLDTARAEAARWRAVLKAGRDPIAERQRLAEEEARRLASEKTFEQVAEILITEKEEEEDGDWDSPRSRSAAIWRASLVNHAYPVLQFMHPRDVEMSHVLKVLEPIWKRIPVTAARVRGRVHAVLRKAEAMELRSGPNPARWEGGLQDKLSSPKGKGKKRKKKHFPALPWKQIGVFMLELRAKNTTGARALEFLILTAARGGMVRLAEWSEIDFEQRVWHVPADHMKGQEAFDVPLSDAALAVLRAQADGRANPAGLIFPGIRRGRPLSDMTLGKVVKVMSVMRDGTLRYQDPLYRRPPVPHGFRSTFRDWFLEATGYPRAIAELALAHEIGDDVEAAYARGTAFEIRAMVMEAWATFCGRGNRPWSPAELRHRPGLDLPGGAVEMLGPTLQPLLANLLREALRGDAPAPAEAGTPTVTLEPALHTLLAGLLQETLRGAAQAPTGAG